MHTSEATQVHCTSFYCVVSTISFVLNLFPFTSTLNTTVLQSYGLSLLSQRLTTMSHTVSACKLIFSIGKRTFPYVSLNLQERKQLLQYSFLSSSLFLRTVRASEHNTSDLPSPITTRTSLKVNVVGCQDKGVNLKMLNRHLPQLLLKLFQYIKHQGCYECCHLDTFGSAFEKKKLQLHPRFS